MLVDDDWLDEEDIHVDAYISEAVDALLANVDLRYYHGGYNRRCRTLGDSPGAVRVRITPELIERLPEAIRGDRRAIRLFIEDCFRRYYLTHIDNPPRMPCVCKRRIEVCDCIDRHRSRHVGGQMQEQWPKRPWPGPPVSKLDLYSEPEARWVREQKTTEREDDEKIKSHAKVMWEKPKPPDEWE